MESNYVSSEGLHCHVNYVVRCEGIHFFQMNSKIIEVIFSVSLSGTASTMLSYVSHDKCSAFVNATLPTKEGSLGKQFLNIQYFESCIE